MYKTLATLALVLVPVLATSGEPPEARITESSRTETAEPPKPKPEFTEEQMDKLKAAEVQYKDNPAMMKLIKQVKEQSGMTEEVTPAQPPPPPLPPKHISTAEGSRDAAHAAYSRKDYATALEQYKALAASGDPEANAILGMMYEGGIGTEPDMAEAQAWYKRAAEEGAENNQFSKMVTDKTIESYEKYRISEEDSANANEVYEEINKEISEYGSTEQINNQTDTTSASEAETGPYSQYPSSVGYSERAISYSSPKHEQIQNVYNLWPRVVKITPEKIEHMRHLRPEGQVYHLHPEKFHKQRPANQG